MQEIGEPRTSIAKGQTFKFEPEEQVFLSFVGNQPRRTAKEPFFAASIELITLEVEGGGIAPEVTIDESAEEGGGLNVVLLGIIGGSILLVAVIIGIIYLTVKAKGS